MELPGGGATLGSKGVKKPALTLAVMPPHTADTAATSAELSDATSWLVAAQTCVPRASTAEEPSREASGLDCGEPATGCHTSSCTSVPLLTLGAPVVDAPTPSLLAAGNHRSATETSKPRIAKLRQHEIRISPRTQAYHWSTNTQYLQQI